MGQVNAFLAADALLEYERLATQLSVMTVAAQGSREGIRQLHTQLQQAIRHEN